MEPRHAAGAIKTSAGTAGGRGKIMLVTPDRVVYIGLLGKPLTREFGALAIYVSLGSPFQIRSNGGRWESAELRVIQPGMPHQIKTVDRLIGMVILEAESICLDRLPPFFQPTSSPTHFPAMHARLRCGLAALLDGVVTVDSIRSSVDSFFFGTALASRTLDPRMEDVVNRIKAQPGDTLGAEDFAQQVDLSFSRFLHLFKAEVGTPFRRFRAWKRARNFLCYVNTSFNLTHIALETGYPDASHFSHTIRRYWGLTPKDILAGSRRLAVTMDGGKPAVPMP